MTVIEISKLKKVYGKTVAVEDVSFSVEQGEIFGILGPNGAGKTTTVECISGLRRPDSGTIRVFGLDPKRDRAELHEIVGTQLQESKLPEKLRVGEAIELFASFYKRRADTERLLREFGIEAKRDTAFENLSGGQKQRLSIALALVGRPKVAILDELTTGLDPQARRETWALIEKIRDSGVTVLLVTHFMEEAERLCDRLAVIDRGRVAALDSPAGLISQVSIEQRVRFRPSGPFDERTLAELPEVTSVSTAGADIIVNGNGDLLPVLNGALAVHNVVATELRQEKATLDDAFLALTGRTLKDDRDEEEAVR